MADEQVAPEPEYPEHIKLRAIADRSQAIGSFLDWLTNDKKIVLATYENPGRWQGGRELFPAYSTIKQLLEEYFEIDGNKLEDEKLQMLDQLRQAHETGYQKGYDAAETIAAEREAGADV